jgi:hypothetical protein
MLTDCKRNYDKLYLVTKNGERHEDHIPCGVFTFEEFKRRFPCVESESEFKPNVWKEIYALNAYYVRENRSFFGDIDAICATKESFRKYCEDIEERNVYDGQYVCYGVIQIVVNAEMGTT